VVLIGDSGVGIFPSTPLLSSVQMGSSENEIGDRLTLFVREIQFVESIYSK
jgi:hypothetical protein